MHIKVNIQARALTVAVAGLMFGLSGCGSSDTPSGSEATTPETSSPPASSPATTAPETTTASTKPSKSAPTGASKGAGALIGIKSFKYAISGPVAPGETIKVTNEDPDNHTVTSVKPGAFDVTVNGGGGKATFKAPKTPGSYVVICTFHANMKGTLVVK